MFFLCVHLFELQKQVPAKTDLVLVEGMFCQSVLRGLVSSAYREEAKRSKDPPQPTGQYETGKELSQNDRFEKYHGFYCRTHHLCLVPPLAVPRAQVTGTIWPWQEQDQPMCNMQAA